MPTATNFPTVIANIETFLEGLTPKTDVAIEFIKTDGTIPLMDHPISTQLTRKFEIDEEPISDFNDVTRNDLVRDVKKEISISVAYHIARNKEDIRDMIARDEHQIAYEMQSHLNYGTFNVYNVNMAGGERERIDGRTVVIMNFLLHYLHEAV